MADRKITDLTALAAGSQATGDLVTIVDVSEAAAADKNKKMTMENLFKGIPGDVGINVSSPASNLHVKGNDIVQYVEATGTAAEICFRNNTSTGNNIRIGGSGNNLTFDTGGSESARIDSSGRFLLGTSTARAVGGESNPRLHIEGVGASSNSWVNISRYANSGGGPAIQLAKSRGASGGSYTVVQSGDTLGTLGFLGSDGTDLANYGAQIRGQVDGTPGSNSIPGRLIFSTTADSGSSPTERLRIDNSGKISTGGETSPDCNPGGLCLDQNAGDGIILSFKSSDVSHGMTNFDQTDTYFSARKVSGDKGGLRLRSYTDAAGADPAVLVQAYINSDADASYVPITLLGGKKSGAGSANISSNRRILEVKNADGTRIASFTGTGIAFGNDTATANALDDYEEGTFTPVIQGASSAGTGTYSTQYGEYVKIGRAVTINLRIEWTAHTGSGNMQISGLPFNGSGRNSGNNLYTFSCYSSKFDFGTNATSPIVYVPGSSSVIQFRGFVNDSNRSVPSVNSDSGGSVLALTGTYQV